MQKTASSSECDQSTFYYKILDGLKKMLVDQISSLGSELILWGANVADEKFDNHPTKVLTKEAAEIDDINVIRENDHLYVIDEETFVSAPQGASRHSLLELNK